MLSSITPLGERARHNRFAVTAGAYVAGTVLGGASSLGLVASLGSVVLPDPGEGSVVAVGAVALLALGLEVVRRGAWLPSWHRQVNEDWLDEYRGTVYGFGFGFQLGTGVMTIVTTGLIHVLYAVAFLSGSPVLGVALGVVFGLSRSLVLLAVAGVVDAQSLRSAHRRLQARAVLATRTARSAVAVVALVGLGAPSLVMGS